MINKIKLLDKMKQIKGKPFSPIRIIKVNDQVIRMALTKGEYHWHKHTNEDELFYVIKGKILIQLKEHPNITLRKGEMVVIPKGIEHCPKSLKSSYVLLFEPLVLKTIGD